MASVTLANIKKKYGDTEVLHGINLQIPDGQFVVLLGPSGCGKSTLLRMLAGLEVVTAGEIYIGSRRVNNVHPKDRNIAMVFQNYALYAHMTVRNNMAFSMKLKKIDKKVIEKRVQWAAEILGLELYLDRFPKELSGGQRQRVAMGRAIVRAPDVFLFDEPLSNLDAKLRVQMRTEIKGLHKKLKTTTVYVTHDQIEAMTMADIVVIMRDGMIEQLGPPLEIYDYPANLFVAEFIGSPSMNLLSGEVVAHENKPEIRSGSLNLPILPTTKVSIGQKVIWGIRPEHLTPLINGNGLSARINVIEPTGAEIHLYVDLAGFKVSCIARERLDWSVDRDIKLMPMLQRVHLFDAKSKQAISMV